MSSRREVHLTIPIAPEMEIAATAQVAALGEWMEMAVTRSTRSRWPSWRLYQRVRTQPDPDRRSRSTSGSAWKTRGAGALHRGRRRDAGKGFDRPHRDAEPSGEAESKPQARVGDQDHRELMTTSESRAEITHRIIMRKFR